MSAAVICEHGAEEIRMRVPQSSIGLLFGKRGATLHQLQEETGCKIHVDRRSVSNASVRIRSTCPKNTEREASLARCARIIEILCDSEPHAGNPLVDALSKVDLEVAAEAAVLRDAEECRYQEEMVGQVKIAVGSSFTEASIREALAEVDWNPDSAQDHLFRMAECPKPALNMQKLLEASRAANATRKANLESALPSAEQSSDSEDVSSSASTNASYEERPAPVPKHIQAIRDVFASIRRY